MRIFLFLLCFLQLIMGNDFFLILRGKWNIYNGKKDLPSFIVNQDMIESKSDSGHLTIDTKDTYYSKNNKTMIMELENINIKRKPKDWYNFVKYSKFIYYFNLIQKNGLHLEIIFLQPNQIEVNCSSNDVNFGQIVLEKESE